MEQKNVFLTLMHPVAHGFSNFLKWGPT